MNMHTRFAEQLVINNNNLLKPHHRLSAWGITLFFWGALLYLWQPLISMIAWAFNIKLFYNHMVILGGYKTFFSAFIYYSVAIFILGGSLLLWAKVNELRFRGANKRNGGPTQTLADVAHKFDTTTDLIEQAQCSKITQVKLGPRGQLCSIQTTAGQANDTETQ